MSAPAAPPYRITVAAQNVGIALADESGSAGVLRQIVGGLERAGHAVRLLALQGTQVRLVEAGSDFRAHREAALGLSGSRPFRLAERALRRGQRALHLPYYALLDSRRFYEACLRALPGQSLCHEFVGLLSPGAALAARRLALPYFLSADADLLFELESVGRPLRGLRGVLARWALRLSYRTARRVIVVSDAAKQQLLARWPLAAQRIAVLPNSVEVARFASGDGAAARARWGLGAAGVILFVGAFQPWHGLDRLVAAFEPLHAARPATRLLLVGDGPMRAATEAAVARAGLAHAVTFTGMRPQDEVPGLLAAADLVVLPYPRLAEPLWFSPLKLYEAMAAGRAIVASRDGQIAQVIEDGVTGRLVEPGDVAGLAAALRALLDQPTERARLGRAAAQQAAAAHSRERYVARLEAIYAEGLEEGAL